MTLGGTVVPQRLSAGRVIAARPINGATLDIQGPPGADGAPDHGYVAYAEGAAGPPIVLAPGLRAQVLFTVTSVADGIAARSPFKAHALWDGALIRPRAIGDTAIVRLDLTSTALVAGGNIEIQLDIGAPFGVIQQITRALKAAAGAPERISEAFPVYMGAAFLANGGALYLETSTPVALTALGLVFFPLAAAGA